MIWSYFLLTIGIIILIASIVWLLITWLKERRTPNDDCLILNLSSHLDGSGRALLSEINTETTSYNNRKIITAIPRDVDWKKLGKNNEKVEEIKTIIEDNKVIVIPKGTWSKDKNIKIILPPNSEDIPDEIRNTLFGKLLAQITEDRNFDKTILEIIRKGSDLKTQYLNKLGDGEISNELIQQYEDIYKNLKDLVEKKQQTSLTYPHHDNK